MLQLPDCFIGLMAATWPIGAASCTRLLLHPQEQMTNCQITSSWVFTPQQITWAIGQKSQIIWFVKFLNNHKPIFAFVAMAWKSIPTVCSQMCSRKGRAGENLAARPSFAATRRCCVQKFWSGKKITAPEAKDSISIISNGNWNYFAWNRMQASLVQTS